METSAFFLAIDCPECGETLISDGYAADFANPPKRGIPIANLSLFMHNEWHCDKCGTTVYSGDADSMLDWEQGDNADDGEWEDDADDDEDF